MEIKTPKFFSEEARKLAHEILSDPKNSEKSEVEIFAELLHRQAAHSMSRFVYGIMIGLILGSIINILL